MIATPLQKGDEVKVLYDIKDSYFETYISKGEKVIIKDVHMNQVGYEYELPCGFCVGKKDLEMVNPPQKTFPQMVAEELIFARKKHGPVNSIHEGYAVILEELDEVWNEVKKKTDERILKNF
jgi:hypothetical protein